MNTVQRLTDTSPLARAAAKVKRHVLPLFVIMFIVRCAERIERQAR